MKYDEILILIPSHGLEDFPTDLAEKSAAGLLNAFAVAWHPVLLAESRSLPLWHRADLPPDELANRLIFVPAACEKTVPGGFVADARRAGAVVLAGLTDRAELEAAALEPLGEKPSVAPEIVADFYALGTAWLQMELLTRYMHHFSTVDETQLQKEALAAADAALAADADAVRAHLKTCFEMLLEVRERFYPVDCYLLDLCLLIPRLADDHLERLLAAPGPVNYLATAADLEQIAAEKPELIAAMKTAWDERRADLVGGEWNDAPTPLLPVESVLWQFRRGRAAFRRLFGRVPRTWGRRRFGLSTNLPQILHRFGYHSALHLVMDDGVYPDAEQAKIRWEGCDGSIVDAITRIPLAADGAASYLRFAQRLGESMEQDHVAALLLAHWPEVKSPWLEDLRRIHAYAPVLGRFVTLDEFIEQTDTPGRLSRYEEAEYLTPFFIQAAARREADPVTRFADSLSRRARFDAGCWFRSLAAVLRGRPVDTLQEDEQAAKFEAAGPDADRGAGSPACRSDRGAGFPACRSNRGAGFPACRSNETEPNGTEQSSGTGANAAADATNAPDSASGQTRMSAPRDLDEFVTESAESLAEIVMAGGGDRPGYLLLNPLSFARRVSVELAGVEVPPATGGPVKAVQFDDDHRHVVVEVPGAGFAWIPRHPHGGEEVGRIADPSTASTPRSGRIGNPSYSGPPMAEEDVLRNEFFEVYLHAETGGIAQIKGYGRKPNRLSQQLAFRFPREKEIPPREEGQPPTKMLYSLMRRKSARITCAGPACGEIVCEGDLFDPETGAALADYRQTVRVWRGRPVVEIDIELDLEHLPEGDPWSNYFASRFAWNDSTAVLTRCVQQGAHGYRGERIESPWYLEIATDDDRTTILPHGLPFHRISGPRMVDTILVAEGETRRRFRMTIAIDADYPLLPALDALAPVAVVRTDHGPPRVGPTGWLFHLDLKNVQIARIAAAPEPNAKETASRDPDAASVRVASPAADSAFILRLIETDGLHRQARLRCFRAPSAARQCDFQGNTIATLRIEDDAVLVDITPFEIVELELQFGERR
ncbi:MAG: hypothetical protein WD066_00880 [Planctomycetaceae bacterium]